MLNRRMLVMSRRVMLGTSFFAGASLLFKGCANYVSGLRAKGASVEWVAPTEELAASSSPLQIIRNSGATELAAAYVDTAVSLEVQRAIAQPPYNFVSTHKNAPILEELAQKLGESPSDRLDEVVFIPDWQAINPNRSA